MYSLEDLLSYELNKYFSTMLDQYPDIKAKVKELKAEKARQNQELKDSLKSN